MKILSLFSGIGAFEAALKRQGINYELAGYCEIDKFASRSYAAVHDVPETMNLGDITKIDTDALPDDIDLITYGFPCQDISLAGKQKGLFNEDGSQTRSGLFFEALRIIEATRPKIAIAENVKNLVGKKFKNQFQIVLESLESAGYTNYWKVLNAKDYGIPQNRERVFIISIRNDVDDGKFQFPEGIPLELRLKDILEPEVDEKYFLSDEQCQKIKSSTFHSKRDSLQTKDFCDTILARDYKDPKCVEVQQVGQLYGTEKEPNPSGGRVYSTDGCMRALGAGHGMSQPYIAVAAAMRGRYSESGDVNQNIEISDREIANAVTTVQKDSMVAEIQAMTPKRTEYGKAIRKDYEAGRISESRHNMTELVPRDDGIANTLTTVCKDNYLYNPATLRIRKLTPKECWRLMGFDDVDFEKAEVVNSNSQLYKQAGNSIVVNVLEAIFNKLFHKTKGENMELKMQEFQFPETIKFNFEELKKEITDKAELYKNMVYSDDTIKDAKSDKAALNKFVKVLEDKRIAVKKQCLQPYEEFEKQVKELVSIVDEPIKLIDGQIKEYEEKKKAEKLDKIKEFWETTTHPDWLTCKMIFDQKWLNATTSMKKIHESITERLENIAVNLDTLESLPQFSFEAIEVYKETLDINKAIAEGQRLADIQKRKQEAEAAKAAEEARKAAETAVTQEEIAQSRQEYIDAASANGVHPTVTMPPEVSGSTPDDDVVTPGVFWVKFEALLTVEQSEKLKKFFEAEGIEFRAI
jgi:DNA (cytosine-5)-methyltransferase 1